MSLYPCLVEIDEMIAAGWGDFTPQTKIPKDWRTRPCPQLTDGRLGPRSKEFKQRITAGKIRSYQRAKVPSQQCSFDYQPQVPA